MSDAVIGQRFRVIICVRQSDLVVTDGRPPGQITPIDLLFPIVFVDLVEVFAQVSVIGSSNGLKSN